MKFKQIINNLFQFSCQESYEKCWVHEIKSYKRIKKNVENERKGYNDNKLQF